MTFWRYCSSNRRNVEENFMHELMSQCTYTKAEWLFHVPKKVNLSEKIAFSATFFLYSCTFFQKRSVPHKSKLSLILHSWPLGLFNLAAVWSILCFHSWRPLDFVFIVQFSNDDIHLIFMIEMPISISHQICSLLNPKL